MKGKSKKKTRRNLSVEAIETAIVLLDQCLTIGQREKLDHAVHLLMLAQLEMRKAAQERWSATALKSN